MTLAQLIAADSGVELGYQHKPKRVTPGQPLETAGALLKWYALHPDDRPVPEAIGGLARAALTRLPLEARGLGLALLHRCGNDFYFLIVCTWRNSNELWETVFYKDGDSMAEFAPFPREGVHKPTLCVWELVPVWHEQQAWKRFLASARDLAAGEAWAADRYEGPA